MFSAPELTEGRYCCFLLLICYAWLSEEAVTLSKTPDRYFSQGAIIYAFKLF